MMVCMNYLGYICELNLSSPAAAASSAYITLSNPSIQEQRPMVAAAMIGSSESRSAICDLNSETAALLPEIRIPPSSPID